MIGSMVASTGDSMYNNYENQKYQNKLRTYAQDPTKMNAYADQFTKHLNAGLTTGVANNTQSYLAQRGLTDSPQISEQVEAQAIAPYVQQNEQNGYQDALSALNLGGGASSSSSSSSSSPLLALMMMNNKSGGSSGGGMGSGGWDESGQVFDMGV
jgi:hypothetical protein